MRRKEIGNVLHRLIVDTRVKVANVQMLKMRLIVNERMNERTMGREGREREPLVQ